MPKPSLFIENDSIEDLKILLSKCDKRKLSKSQKILQKDLLNGCNVILKESDT